MWRNVLDYSKQLFSLTRDTQQNKENIKELRQEIKEVRQELAALRQEMNQTRLEFGELIRVVEHIAYRTQRDRENTQHEYEKLLLRLQLALKDVGRELPPSDPQGPEGTSNE